MIHVTHISDAEFGRLAAEWNALRAAAGIVSPMLTWEWAFSWWETYGGDGRDRVLHLLAARDEQNGLVGLLPLVRRSGAEFGLGFRRLEFVGTGERESDETCSEYLDAIVLPAVKAEVAAAFAEDLRRDKDWDELAVPDVRADMPSSMGLIQAELNRDDGFLAWQEPSGDAPWIALPSTWDSYLSSLSAKRRKRIVYERRHLASQGAVQFRCARQPGEMREAFDVFVRLHQGRWAAEGRPGCFASPLFSRFMERLTDRLAACGGVRIALLSVGGEPLAALYLLQVGSRQFFYNGGRLVDRLDRCSPGNVIVGHAIEQAITDGLCEFHFLKGGEGCYKYHWAREAVPLCSYALRRKTFGPAVRAGLRRGRRLARAVLRGLGCAPKRRSRQVLER